MAKFVGKAKVKSQQRPDVCEYLSRDYKLGVEDSTNPANMVTLLQDMLAERLC